MARTPKAPEPITERQIVPDEVRGEFETRSPEGAFGGVDRQNINDIGKDVDLATKIQNSADEFQVNQAKNAFLTQKSQFLPQVLNTQGKNAVPFSPDLEDGTTGKWFADSAKSTLAMAQNGRQQRQIQEFISNQDSEVRSVIQNHIAKQLTLASGKENLDLIKNNLNQAPMVYNNPTAREQGRQAVVDATNKLMDWKGVDKDDPERKFQIDSQTSNWDAMVVQSYLAHSDAKGASDYLKGLADSGQLVGPKLNNLQKPVDNALTKDNALNFYSGNAFKFKDEQGYTNDQALIENFRESPDYAQMSPQQQKTAESTLLAKAGQDKKMTDEQKSSRWNKFQDVLQKALDSNAPLSKLQTIPDQIGGFGSEKLRMEDFINRRYQERTGISIFSGKSDNLAATKANLYEAIQDGTLTDRETIGKLFDAGQLNTKELASAYKMFDTVNKGGPAKGIQMTRNLIVKQAMDVLPEDQVNQFRGELAEQTQGMDAKAMQEWAKERLDPQLKNPAHFWDRIMGNNEAAKDMSEDDMIKSLSFEVGKEPVNAMLSALATPANPKPGLNDIEGFLHKLGDVPASEITRGKPINNAMQSIINWNRNAPPSKIIPFTPEAIKYLAGKNNGYFEP